MPKLTLKAARDLQSSFTGRITSSHEAQAEFHDQPTVLIPESVADVERALRLAQAANRRVFVRSGRRVSKTDVTAQTKKSTRAIAGDRSASVIVSLEAFRDITFSDHRLNVGAAATTSDVARKLVGRNLFLPLDDNRTQSLVSAVLSLEGSPFLRSGTDGSLRDAVVEADVVPTEGAGAGRAKTVRKKGLRDVLGGNRPAVITKLVLDADTTNIGESDRWVRTWTAVYERKTFAALCDDLLGENAQAFPETVDLSVRATSASYGLKLVIVRTTGHGDAEATETVLQAAFRDAKIALLESREAKGAGSSIAAWVATAPNEAAPGEVLTRFGSNSTPRQFAKFRRPFLDAVDFALGVSPRTGRERAPRVRAWAELQLTAKGDVLARAELSDSEADPKVANKARARMAAAIPPDKVSARAPRASRRALIRRAPARAALRGVTVLPNLAATAGFELVSSNRAGANLIPGFKGDLFQKSDGRSYAFAIQQYAVSSYSQAVVNARMTPRFVAVPTDAADVALAVTFAAQKGLKVVTRSGGHQYCGLSSGGADTLLIDMKLFCGPPVFSPSTGVPTQVVVQPGVSLRRLSSELRDREVLIPHGECPLVNLGGHVQTGGIGHQLRSLGATLDWVRSFKMVMRDPQSPSGAAVYIERQFSRPNPGGAYGSPTDDDVFRAALGGGPGSWGVLTEITFDLVSDEAHPYSAGYSYAYPYVFGVTEDGFRAAMEQVRQWADRESRGLLPPGIDLFLTVVSGDFPRPAVLLVEASCTDEAGVPEIRAVVNAVDAAVPAWVRLAARASSQVSGRESMSVIADEGVRGLGTFGLPGGREFDLPYRKSLYITKAPFSASFRDQFVALVDDVNKKPGLKVVFQTVIGGGDFRANGQRKTTHMQRRDALVQLVFDVFFKEGFEGEAQKFQRSMKTLLGGFSGGADVRMSWGSFEDEGTNGAQLDMSRTATQALYYDSAAEYARLQQIKAFSDPDDLFHTPFTVK